jgi:hypothetical protein
VVHLSLLEWIGLGCILWLVLWAVGGVLPSLLTLEAGDTGKILLGIRVEMVLSISSTVVSIVSTVMTIGVVSPESSIVPVAIEVSTITFVEVASMPVRVSSSTALRKAVSLVKGFSVIFASVELPLAVLLLPDIIV